ncbi:hypothetical protein BKA70DRAFT_1235435 [Coprinopsis sp. MPI-PUGE-AT-0042]|nr:hypothetical protein BKA70DRAFT_1235435 [Coprinopsis sp. MPI-PUGE-AT-0042]
MADVNLQHQNPDDSRKRRSSRQSGERRVGDGAGNGEHGLTFLESEMGPRRGGKLYVSHLVAIPSGNALLPCCVMSSAVLAAERDLTTFMTGGDACLKSSSGGGGGGASCGLWPRDLSTRLNAAAHFTATRLLQLHSLPQAFLVDFCKRFGHSRSRRASCVTKVNLTVLPHPLPPSSSLFMRKPMIHSIKYPNESLHSVS